MGTFEGPDAAVGAGRFGFDVAGAGDVDGDGFVDLLVGAPSVPNAGFGTGRAYVLRSHGGAFDLAPVTIAPPLTSTSLASCSTT
jgi:hypothetical protein